MSKWFSYKSATTSHCFYEHPAGHISSCRVGIVPSVDDIEDPSDKPRCKRCEKIEANGGPVWK